MLEIPRGDTTADWPDDRTWSELRERLHAVGEPDLAEVELIERDILDLRVRVIAPMHHGRVYLAGDAAHLITPAGGKGMNLAIQDALELGRALCERYDGDRRGTRLAHYSMTRLPAIWRTQEFSNWMLGLMHTGTSQRQEVPEPRHPAKATDFSYELKRARLHELVENQDLARWFAHAYAGVEP